MAHGSNGRRAPDRVRLVVRRMFAARGLRGDTVERRRGRHHVGHGYRRSVRGLSAGSASGSPGGSGCRCLGHGEGDRSEMNVTQNPLGRRAPRVSVHGAQADRYGALDSERFPAGGHEGLADLVRIWVRCWRQHTLAHRILGRDSLACGWSGRWQRVGRDVARTDQPFPRAEARQPFPSPSLSRAVRAQAWSRLPGLVKSARVCPLALCRRDSLAGKIVPSDAPCLLHQSEATDPTSLKALDIDRR